jgi:hypothetical protein
LKNFQAFHTGIYAFQITTYTLWEKFSRASILNLRHLL